MSTEIKNAIPVALTWLQKEHQEEATRLVLGQFFPSPDKLKGFHPSKLPPEFQAQLDVNSGDWFLFEGRLEENGKHLPVIEILTEMEDTGLVQEQKLWLRGQTDVGLRLYLLESSVPDKNVVWLKDIMSPGLPSFPVVDPILSHGIHPGAVLGCRLLAIEERLESSGALYLFSPEEAEEVLKEFVTETKERELEEGEESYRRALSRRIVHSWILSLISPQEGPVSEEPVLVTDHFRVDDMELFDKRVGYAPELKGGKKTGWQLHIKEEPVASLLLRENGILDLTSSEPGKADEYVRALRQLLGDSIRFISRENMTGDGSDAVAAGVSGGSPTIEGLDKTRMIQEMIESKFKDWGNRQNPTLDGKTPLEIMDTEEGEILIRSLIDRYEADEAEKAAKNNRSPVRFDFLRKQVGLI